MTNPYSQVETARQAEIREGKPMVPKEVCHMCGFRVPKGALWCAVSCANEYAEERKKLVAKDIEGMA